MPVKKTNGSAARKRQASSCNHLSLGGHLPANGRSQDIVFIPWRSRLEQAFFVNQPDEGYSGRTCAEGTATQGCDRSADKVAGMAGRRKSPSVTAEAILTKVLVREARLKRVPLLPVARCRAVVPWLEDVAREGSDSQNPGVVAAHHGDVGVLQLTGSSTLDGDVGSPHIAVDS